MKKVIHMVTLSRSIPLMRGQIEYLKEKGYTIGVISSHGKELDDQISSFKKSIEMERNIHIIKDIKSLYELIKYLHDEKPDIINAGTPKAGLLGMIASYIVRVPKRIYTMRGLRLETVTGFKKTILWITEKISCLLATDVVCISPSLHKRAKQLKLIGKKGVVFNRGSSNGVNLERFPPIDNNSVKLFISNFKHENNINENDFILGYVGRITKDKGIYELLDVFLELNKEKEDIKLVILGAIEDDLSDEMISIIYKHKSIFYLDHVNDPALHYYLFDVLIFPTHREGFGNVSIEAQAASVPVITTDATGAVDTIINNITGVLYPVGNKEMLASSILKFYFNKNEGVEKGKNGRSFVENNFQSIDIWNELDKLYKR